MGMVNGIDARTGQNIQVDSSKLVNTYMSQEWADMVSQALEKASAEREASGEGPRNGINVLIDGEYHFFSFEDAGNNRQLSESEIAAFQEKYAADPSMNTLWKILAEMSRMGIINGFIAFNEYQMAQKREQIGHDSMGNVTGGVVNLDTLRSRLENVQYGISIDTAKNADDMAAEAKRYEKLQEMIEMITEK